MTGPRTLTRRRALAWIGAAAALPLASGSGVIGCSTMRLVAGVVPGAQRRARTRESAVMEAFCAAVVPAGADDVLRVSRVYTDAQFPLARRLAVLVHDLDAQSKSAGFDRLSETERRRIILAGAEAKGPLGRLYRGAMLLTQVAFYASIYDDARGCAAIDYPGAKELLPASELTYPDPEAFLGQPMTADGNPA